MHGKAKLRPWEIGRLTPAEVAMLLDEDIESPRPPSNAKRVFGSVFERNEWITWRRSLTPREALELARRGEL